MNNLIFKIISDDKSLQNNVIDLCSYSNFLSEEAIDIEQKILSNKLLLNDRFINKLKLLTEENVKKLFCVKYANIISNLNCIYDVIFDSLLDKNDKILVFEQNFDNNIRNKKYEYTFYDVDKNTLQISYSKLKEAALNIKPKLIYISLENYYRKIDFSLLKEIKEEIGAYLIVNITGLSGLIASNLYENPCLYADIVISSKNSSLKTKDALIVLTNDELLLNKINKSLSIYNNTLLANDYASLTVSFENALQDEFINYQKQIIKNSKILCDVLKIEGFFVVSNGTDNHMMLLDVKKSVNLTGKEAEKLLFDIGIKCDKMLIPYDETTPYITSGIKLGVNAMTARGFKEHDFIEVGKIISVLLHNYENKDILDDLKIRVNKLINKYPLYEEVTNE